MKTRKDERKQGWPQGLMLRGASFRYSRMFDGSRLVEVWGEIPESEAIRKARRYNMDIDDGIQPIHERVRARTTVAEFAETWLRKKATELRPRSLARYRAVVDHFLAYLEQVKGMGNPTLNAIAYGTAMDFIAHRCETPLMPNGRKKFTRAIREGASKKTVYFERGVLHQMFRDACKREMIRKNPFEDVRPRKPTVNEAVAAHHPLTADEEAALLKAARAFDDTRKDVDNPRFHDLVLFLVRTGLRLDELRALEWTDIDFRERIIHIREKRVTETRIVKITKEVAPSLAQQIENKAPGDPLFPTKADIEAFGIRLKIRTPADLLKLKVADVDLENGRLCSTRQYVWKPKGTNGIVPMCAAVEELLKRLHEAKRSNFVFAHFDGGSCRLHLLEMLKKVQTLAGIKGRLRIHDLWHTLAFRLRRSGVHLETIMGIMRHADIKETLIYAPYNVSEGQRAMKTLDEAPAAETAPKGGGSPDNGLGGAVPEHDTPTLSGPRGAAEV